MSADVLSLATQNATLWASDLFDAETRAEAQALLEQGGDALIEPFYKDLDFGTGGMRGIMGVGTNRINPYTLRFSHARFGRLCPSIHGTQRPQSCHRLRQPEQLSVFCTQGCRSIERQWCTHLFI